MKIADFVKLYKNSSMVLGVADAIKPNHAFRLKLKGLVGSLDAVVAASVYGLNHQNHLFVLHDKEEAAYFYNDLQNLLQGKEVLFFPTSYKRPYQFDETENANILQRAEILNRINNKAASGELIVTYPEALTEKVINKKSLRENTFSTKVGEQVDVTFLEELLTTYDFEKTDFVYEAGQFSIRGGIVDVFSYAHDLPYRLEFFGDEVDSIRTFDPNTQLSEESLKSINIIPNVQTKLVLEERQSFFDFVPRSTKLWFKDMSLTYDTVDKYFEKASENFEQVLEVAGQTKVVLNPEDLFESAETLKEHIFNFPIIEFGNRFSKVSSQ